MGDVGGVGGGVGDGGGVGVGVGDGVGVGGGVGDGVGLGVAGALLANRMTPELPASVSEPSPAKAVVCAAKFVEPVQYVALLHAGIEIVPPQQLA